MKIKAIALIIAILAVVNGQQLSNNAVGTKDGFSYELWKDYGNTSMQLTGGATFTCEWNNIGNALFRMGRKWDCTKTWQQLGTIKFDYAVNYNPNGNSYLCIYGWTRSPLIEWYIVDSWGSWRPPGTPAKGAISVDGQSYDIYTSDRINQPSIDGNTTFKQFWSVNKSKRTSGTITVSDHFKAWTNNGMQLGKMYEAALTVEGYQSSGKAAVTKCNITGG